MDIVGAVYIKDAQLLYLLLLLGNASLSLDPGLTALTFGLLSPLLLKYAPS
jgi:hypothetical protein